MVIDAHGETGHDYYFARASDHRKIGELLRAEQRGHISNVSVVASWNTSSSRVALLVYYGTKLSELLLFTRSASGRFETVSWQQPDAEAIHQKRTGRPLPRPGDGHSENAVGPWVDENTVRLVSGEDVQTEDQDRYLHLLATFRATVRGRRATISALRLTGWLSDEDDQRFVRRWGGRYFNGTGE